MVGLLTVIGGPGNVIFYSLVLSLGVHDDNVHLPVLIGRGHQYPNVGYDADVGLESSVFESGDHVAMRSNIIMDASHLGFMFKVLEIFLDYAVTHVEVIHFLLIYFLHSLIAKLFLFASHKVRGNEGNSVGISKHIVGVYFTLDQKVVNVVRISFEGSRLPDELRFAPDPCIFSHWATWVWWVVLEISGI